jgi:hypothetical protein
MEYVQLLTERKPSFKHKFEIQSTKFETMTQNKKNLNVQNCVFILIDQVILTLEL